MRARRRGSRRVTPSPTAGHDRWLISYADFVTLLFAVFVVLFAYSLHRKQSIRNVSSAIHSAFEAMSTQPQREDETPLSAAKPAFVPTPGFDSAKLSRQLQSILGDSISRHEIVMQRTSEGLIISLRELGFFNSGEAKLLPGAAEKLQQTAKLLMREGFEVRVEGHSDDQPIHNALFHSNWELSTARAMSVLSTFVDGAEFPPSRISIAGYGAFRPVSTNATPEGRRMNRRVDLVIIAANTSAQQPR